MQPNGTKVLDAAVPGKELHAHVVAARVRMDMKVAWGDVKDQVRARYTGVVLSCPGPVLFVSCCGASLRYHEC